MMARLAIAALVASLAAVPAAAQSQLSQSVERDLRRLNLGVEVSDLSSSQIAALHGIFASNRTESDKRGLAKSVIGGRNSLRGVLWGRR